MGSDALVTRATGRGGDEQRGAPRRRPHVTAAGPPGCPGLLWAVSGCSGLHHRVALGCTRMLRAAPDVLTAPAAPGGSAMHGVLWAAPDLAGAHSCCQLVC
ncbi:hypothetical protein NN561_004195 [Cricetulus griseus]